MVGGLVMGALEKLYRQPSLFASPLTTSSARSARSFLPVSVVAGQTKSAQRPPHGGQQSARVRYQYLIFLGRSYGTPASKWPKVSGQTIQGCAVAQTPCPLCPLRRLFMSAHALSGPLRYGLQSVPRGLHRQYTGGGTPGCRGVRPPVQRHRAPPPHPPRASRRAGPQ
jgi:hypothetical protein